MSLIATEIKELRQMLKQLDAGEITTNVARTKLQVYKESHKRSKLYLDMFVFGCGPLVPI